MRQVDLIASLPQLKKRFQNARSLPLGLSSHRDDHARADGEDRHIQSVAAEAPEVSTDRKCETEHKERSAESANHPKGSARKTMPGDKECGKAAEGDSVHSSEVGVFPPNGIVIEGM